MIHLLSSPLPTPLCPSILKAPSLPRRLIHQPAHHHSINTRNPPPPLSLPGQSPFPKAPKNKPPIPSAPPHEDRDSRVVARGPWTVFTSMRPNPPPFSPDKTPDDAEYTRSKTAPPPLPLPPVHMAWPGKSQMPAMTPPPPPPHSFSSTRLVRSGLLYTPPHLSISCPPPSLLHPQPPPLFSSPPIPPTYTLPSLLTRLQTLRRLRRFPRGIPILPRLPIHTHRSQLQFPDRFRQRRDFAVRVFSDPDSDIGVGRFIFIFLILLLLLLPLLLRVGHPISHNASDGIPVAIFTRRRRSEFQLPDRLPQSLSPIFGRARTVLPIHKFHPLPRMPLPRPRFPKRPFARTADLAIRWEAWFGKALFWREIVVFDEGLIVVGVEFGEEEVLHEADLGFQALEGEGRVGGWWGEGGGEVESRAVGGGGGRERLVVWLGCEEVMDELMNEGGGEGEVKVERGKDEKDIPGVLGLVGVVHPVL